MRRLVASLSALLLFWPIAAGAMSQSQQPAKFPIPWGNGAGAPYIRTIPQASQIGITNCAASLTDGFPPLTFVPATSGGCPPFGQDFNGILKLLSQWSQWMAAGGAPVVNYDASFSTSIGGYPNGATLRNSTISSCTWISTVDNNTSNPDTGGANWVASCPGGGVGGTSTGTANAQTITATPFVTQVGTQVSFVAGFTNTSSLTVTINGVGPTQVYRQWQGGKSLSVGGEVIIGQPVILIYDGTRWVCSSCDFALVGSIKDFSGLTAPPGYLFIDGSCQAQATYADLFTTIGQHFSFGCSAGQFGLPDGRGIVLAGKDNMGSQGAAGRITATCTGTVMGNICGNEQNSLTVSNLPSFSASVSIPSGQGSHTHSLSSSVLVSTNQGGAGSSNNLGSSTAVTALASTLPSMTGTASFSGSNTNFAILPPVQIVTKIIKL